MRMEFIFSFTFAEVVKPRAEEAPARADATNFQDAT